ncbi:RNA-guided endonuclease InsQ/TnpB family protein [Streptomyces europaeiscabiei]|uniref:RNA-guided endonuclease InsQ/TnpB family protein n=1 Tax=Streptomyces europaeiscabiei TaxID=146819 RepID=UPI0038F6BAF6
MLIIIRRLCWNKEERWSPRTPARGGAPSGPSRGDARNGARKGSLRDLDTAYKNFFDSVKGKRQGRKAGPPRYKSKKDTRQSIRLNTNAFSLPDDGTVYGAKAGNLKVEWPRRLPAAPTSLTVTKDSSGRYFLSFVVDTEPDTLPRVEAESGLDLGLSAFAVLSDGTKIDSPRLLRRAEKKLKRLQQELSRRAKGSKNRAKARLKVARRHAKAADQHRDFHHTASTQIIRDNQAVYAEDLAVSGLGRTRLAKSVHDAGWSTFVGMLEYKAALHGRTFAKVDRAFPSSQVCSVCGFRDGPKPLHVREWTCSECGMVHDRDHNAARNVLFEGRRIVAAGRVETLNACRAPVRRAPVPAQRGEAGSPRKGRTTQAGIPGL